MIQEIINDPGLVIIGIGIAIWGIGAHIIESPKHWKLWKFAKPAIYSGVAITVAGVIIWCNGGI